MLESAEAKVVELTAKVNEQQRLIQKLEDDILKVSSKSFSLSLSCLLEHLSARNHCMLL